MSKKNLDDQDEGEKFLRTPRVRQYTKRIYSASLFFIFSTSIEILIWLQLDLIQVNYENSIFVCGTDFILILSTFINVLKLCCFEYTKRDDVMNKLNCIFYFSLFGFLLNLLETVYTLFGSFLNYFEYLAKDYVKSIGINLTFLLVFSIFTVIVINICLSIYIFLMSSKFHSYVRLSENFGLFSNYSDVDVKSSQGLFKKNEDLLRYENQSKDELKNISIEIK